MLDRTKPCVKKINCIDQWFSTFSLKGAKSTTTILLKSSEKIWHKWIYTFCFIAERSLLA